MAVVLINVFEVPGGRDEEFVAGWRATAEHMRRQHGYISTRLHRSLDPHAQFRFINVAEWESPQDLQAVVGSPDFQTFAEQIAFATPHPSLYRIVEE